LPILPAISCVKRITRDEFRDSIAKRALAAGKSKHPVLVKANATLHDVMHDPFELTRERNDINTHIAHSWCITVINMALRLEEL